MIRIFMLGGTYVETQTFESLEELTRKLGYAEKHKLMFECKGKIGERVAIRAAAVAYAVDYKG